MLLHVSGQYNNPKTALLVIDIQDFYFPGGDMPLYEPEVAAARAATLIEHSRNRGDEVIYVKHNYEPGGTINEAVKPFPGEKIFGKNDINPFLGTGLEQYLQDRAIDRLVFCGMQTHMCVEAAVRAASDLGYECVVVQDACTSRDLRFEGYIIKAEDVHRSTLSTLRSYAMIMNTKDYLKQ